MTPKDAVRQFVDDLGAMLGDDEMARDMVARILTTEDPIRRFGLSLMGDSGPADDTEMPSRSTWPSLWITRGKAVDNPVDNRNPEQGVSKRVQALPFGGGSAPTRGPEGASSEGVNSGTITPEEAPPWSDLRELKNHPGCVLGASSEYTAPEPPPLWPGFDPNHPSEFAAAWRAVWTATEAGPIALTEAWAVAHRAGPSLSDVTVRNLVQSGVRERHLRRRGRKPQGRKPDTRTVERRHPNPTEHR